MKKNQKKIDPYVIANDYVTHIKQIINKNWELILSYRAKQQNLINNIDICSASLYNQK